MEYENKTTGEDGGPGGPGHGSQCGDDDVTCQWVSRESLMCQPGFSSCSNPTFLKAEESDFHPAELVEATRAINRILENIPKHPKLELSVLQVNKGLMLAWVEHGSEKIEGGVTAESDPEAIAKCLNLI